MPKTSYKVNVRELAPDSTLEADDGWVNMAVQFLVDKLHGGAQNVVFGRTVFAPGESVHEVHRHSGAEEVIYLVRGAGIATNGEEQLKLTAGDLAFHPKGEWHGFSNASATEEAELIWVWAGAASKEEAGYEIREPD
jgi:quercetin dioxygenase-like cupin family protein